MTYIEKVGLVLILFGLYGRLISNNTDIVEILCIVLLFLGSILFFYSGPGEDE